MPTSEKIICFELTTTHKHFDPAGPAGTLLREDVSKRYFRKSANAYRAQKRAANVSFEVFMVTDYAGQVEDPV